MRTTDKARALRRAQTDAEAKLWWHLRDRRLGTFKFRRQVPIGPYVVDFLCPGRRLAVEVDGGQHTERATYDARRTRFLESAGLTIVRYWDDEVMQRIDDVLEDLMRRLAAPHPNPLPASGEREHG